MFNFTPTIAANTQNYNLKAAAIAAGWNQTDQLNAIVTINSGVYVSSASTGSYAFDTGATFPAGSTLKLINNGVIIGRGGNGGNGYTSTGGYFNVPPTIVPATGGASGGPALRVQYPISISNNTTIAGGGGGGGGKNAIASGDGGGGGGGIGNSVGGSGTHAGVGGTLSAPGAGGAATGSAGYGGAGGSYGSAGAAGLYGVAGGTGGACTSGNGNISWTVVGNRYGALN